MALVDGGQEEETAWHSSSMRWRRPEGAARRQHCLGCPRSGTKPVSWSATAKPAGRLGEPARPGGPGQ
jgi:hypothetical protein